MKKLTITICLILSFGVCLTSAQTIKLALVGVKKRSQPYNVGVKLMRAISKKTGVYIIVNALPAKRAAKLLSTGKIDGELSRTAGFEKSFPDMIKIEEPIVSMPYYAYTITAELKVNGWDSLNPYKVIYIKGHKDIEINLKPIHKKLHPVKNNGSALGLLVSKRADIFVASPLSVERLLLLKKYKKAGIKALSPPIAVMNSYTYLHSKHVKFAEQFEIALKEMKEEGTYKKILTETR